MEKSKLTKLLVEKMNTLGEKIVHWDQDVLNSYFDGEFLEIKESLNFNAVYADRLNKEVKIIHYIGSKNPGTLVGFSNLVQNTTMKIIQKLIRTDIILCITGKFLN